MNCKHEWTGKANYDGMEVRICSRCKCHSFRFSVDTPFSVASMDYLSSLPCEQSTKIIRFILLAVGDELFDLACATDKILNRIINDEELLTKSILNQNKKLLELEKRLMKIESSTNRTNNETKPFWTGKS